MEQGQIDNLAWNIATFGIQQFEDEVRVIAQAALGNGLAISLAQVLVDTSEPSIARERAFGRVATALSRLESRPVARFPAA